MICASSCLTARIISQATVTSLPTPSLSMARRIVTCARGATCWMIPATKVPCPAARSRYPSPSGSGNRSSGPISPEMSCSHPSVRTWSDRPVSMIATLADLPLPSPNCGGPAGGSVGCGAPIPPLPTGAVGVM